MDYDYIGLTKRLRDVREDLDLKQAEIASRLKVKQGSYSRWEKGKEIIPLNRLNEFCNITGATIDYVLGLTNRNKYAKVKKEIDFLECGKRLKHFRTNKDLSQKELAEKLNTTQSTISAYERGKVRILTAFAYDLAKNYSLSVDWLLARSETPYLPKEEL